MCTCFDIHVYTCIYLWYIIIIMSLLSHTFLSLNIIILPLRKFSVAKYDKTIKEVATEKIQKDFLTMEEQEVHNVYRHVVHY